MYLIMDGFGAIISTHAGGEHPYDFGLDDAMLAAASSNQMVYVCAADGRILYVARGGTLVSCAQQRPRVARRFDEDHRETSDRG